MQRSLTVRVRQKDIAKRLGLSTSLVSRALAGKAASIGVRPETVLQIEQTARALGYVPSAAARQLRGTSAGIVGVVAADLQDPFFGPAVAELIRQSHQAGYALSLVGFDQRDAESPDLGLLLQQDLSGLVVVGSGPLPWLQPFLARDLAVARIGSGPAPDGACNIAMDEAQAAAALADHIAGLGHQRVALVGADLAVHRERCRLLARALKLAGLAITAQAFGPAAVLEAGVEGARRLLEHTGARAPTTILCSSDTVALGVLRELADRGLRVPQDLSVTGFDDLALARLVNPPLTTIRQPLPDLVRAALQHLADPRARAPAPLKGHLIPRASTGLPSENPVRSTHHQGT